MGLVSSVTEKVRNLAPDRTNRWDDAFIRKLVHAADCAIKEEAGSSWGSTDIALLDNVAYYTLPTNVVAVGKVEFSLDGTTFDDGLLKPITYKTLDEDLSRTWRDDRGTQPHHYLLLSTPGIHNYSKILIWRPVSSVTSETIRVHFTQCYPHNTSDFSDQTVPEEVEDLAYVPYVLALLYAPEDHDQFKDYWFESLDGILRVRTKYGSQYGEGLGPMKDSGPALSQGQL